MRIHSEKRDHCFTLTVRAAVCGSTPEEPCRKHLSVINYRLLINTNGLHCSTMFYHRVNEEVFLYGIAIKYRRLYETS